MIIGISGKIGSGKDTAGQIIQYLNDYKSFRYTHPTTESDFNSWLKNEHFKKSHWKIKKFANKLKDIVCLLIGCTREQLEDEEFKNTELGEEWWKYQFIEAGGNSKNFITIQEYNDLTKNKKQWWKLIKPTPRLLLQLIGTECGRDIIHPNIWVNSLMSEYKQMVSLDNIENPFYPNWIITDVRFPNETQAIKNKDGILIRINRDFDIKKFDKNNPKHVELKIGGLLKQHESETALDNYQEWDFVIENNETITELIEKLKQYLEKIENF